MTRSIYAMLMTMLYWVPDTKLDLRISSFTNKNPSTSTNWNQLHQRENKQKNKLSWSLLCIKEGRNRFRNIKRKEGPNGWDNLIFRETLCKILKFFLGQNAKQPPTPQKTTSIYKMLTRVLYWVTETQLDTRISSNTSKSPSTGTN